MRFDPQANYHVVRSLGSASWATSHTVHWYTVSVHVHMYVKNPPGWGVESNKVSWGQFNVNERKQSKVRYLLRKKWCRNPWRFHGLASWYRNDSIWSLSRTKTAMRPSYRQGPVLIEHRHPQQNDLSVFGDYSVGMTWEFMTWVSSSEHSPED